MKHRSTLSYEDRLKQIAQGRGGKKMIGQKLYVHKEQDDSLTYRLWGETVATHSKNDVITFLFDFKDDADQTAMRRLEKCCCLTLLFCSDRSRHGNKLQPIRVYNSYRKEEEWEIPYGSKSLPYTPGLKINLNGKILNPEICVDYVRVLDKSAAHKVRKNIDELAAYARAITRLKGFSPQEGEVDLNSNLLKRAKEGFPDLNYNDVVELVRLGKYHTTSEWWYVHRRKHNTDKEEALAEYYRDCVKNGIKRLRKQLYAHHQLYSYVPVGEVNQSTKEQSCN